MLNDYKLDKGTPVPLYFQLKTLILDRIKDGTYRPGELIPTENELSAMFDISRTTVRQAVTELVREGYLYRIKSKGTFVAKPKVAQKILNRYFSHEEAVKEAGREMNIEVLKLEVVPITQQLIDLGAGKEGDQVIHLYRRRLVDGVPMARIETYLSYEKFSYFLNEDLASASLMSLMNRSPETRVYRLKRTIEAMPSCREDVLQLDVDSGSAIQKMTTVRYNKAGEFLDIGTAYYRADMCTIEVEIIQPENDKEQA